MQRAVAKCELPTVLQENPTPNRHGRIDSADDFSGSPDNQFKWDGVGYAAGRTVDEPAYCLSIRSYLKLLRFFLLLLAGDRPVATIRGHNVNCFLVVHIGLCDSGAGCCQRARTHGCEKEDDEQSSHGRIITLCRGDEPLTGAAVRLDVFPQNGIHAARSSCELEVRRNCVNFGARNEELRRGPSGRASGLVRLPPESASLHPGLLSFSPSGRKCRSRLDQAKGCESSGVKTVHRYDRVCMQLP